jgi:hypothetical protein
MALLRRLDRGAMLIQSHAGDSAAEAAWLWHDIDAESCR